MSTPLINAEVIHRFNNGDELSFAIVYNHFNKAVFVNISKLILNQQIAEDILQDVFVKLWDNKHKLTTQAAIGSWLFTVSFNQSISHIRRLIAEKKMLTHLLTTGVETELSRDNDNLTEFKERLLIDAINQLPARKKEVFELCKIQGKSYSEVAEIMGITTDTVKEYMVQSLKFVRSYITNRYISESVITLSLLSFYLN